MTILTPESRIPGAPVAGPDPAHQPRVPTEAGVPPYCSCGFVGSNGVDGPLLADHLDDVEQERLWAAEPYADVQNAQADADEVG